MSGKTYEDQARDILERMGLGREFSSGDVIELANILADHSRLKQNPWPETIDGYTKDEMQQAVENGDTKIAFNVLAVVSGYRDR